MVRKMIIAVSVAAGFLGFQSPAWAGLKFTNPTSETIWLAVAAPTKDGWQTEGWWEIKPGRTVVVIAGDLQYQYYYIHAHTESRKVYWEGNHMFPVHPTKPFTIKEVDGRRTSLPKGAERIGFRQLDTGPKARDYKWNLKIAGSGTTIID